MKEPSEESNKQLLIKEYDKAQEMVCHYHDLNMRFGTMTQSVVVILIGLALGLLSKDRTMFTYLFPFVIGLVFLLNIMILLWFYRHRSISQIIIERILEIEGQLGWKQFTRVDEAIKGGQIRGWPIRYMIPFYQLSLPIFLIIAYIIIRHI